MHFNKMKHHIRARLSVAKMRSSSDTLSQPASQPAINCSFLKLFSKLYLLFNIIHCSPERHFHAK